LTCENCHDWSSCNGLDWYAPSDIKPCVHQVKWILENYEDIDKGVWPADPMSSMSNRSHSNSASFVRPAENAMEVWKRLQTIQLYSDDADLAINVLTLKWDIVSLSRLMKVPTQRLQIRIDRVLRYCSGKNAKDKNYKEWCQHRKFKRRMP
jgi:hypothetical protein